MSVLHLIELEEMDIGRQWSAESLEALIAALRSSGEKDAADPDGGWEHEEISHDLDVIEREIRRVATDGPGAYLLDRQCVQGWAGGTGDAMSGWAWKPFLLIVP